MEKETTILICSEQGEWNREALAKLEEKQVRAQFVPANGPRLLELLRQERPDMVVTDLFLPGMDAIAVLRSCGREPGQGKPLVVVTSTYTSPLLEREVLAAGAAALVLSPYDPAEMAQRMLTLYAARGRHYAGESSTRSGCRPTSRGTTTCGIPFSWPSRTRRSSTR